MTTLTPLLSRGAVQPFKAILALQSTDMVTGKSNISKVILLVVGVDFADAWEQLQTYVGSHTTAEHQLVVQGLTLITVVEEVLWQRPEGADGHATQTVFQCTFTEFVPTATPRAAAGGGATTTKMKMQHHHILVTVDSLGMATKAMKRAMAQLDNDTVCKDIRKTTFSSVLLDVDMFVDPPAAAGRGGGGRRRRAPKRARTGAAAAAGALAPLEEEEAEEAASGGEAAAAAGGDEAGESAAAEAVVAAS